MTYMQMTGHEAGIFVSRGVEVSIWGTDEDGPYENPARDNLLKGYKKKHVKDVREKIRELLPNGTWNLPKNCSLQDLKSAYSVGNLDNALESIFDTDKAMSGDVFYLTNGEVLICPDDWN